MSKKVQQIITDEYIKLMEEAIENKTDLPWEITWVSGYGRNMYSYATGNVYKGINTHLLPEPGEYVTFNEVRRISKLPENEGKKIHVKKGAKSRMVVRWIFPEDKNKDDDKDKKKDKEDDKKDNGFGYMVYHRVFNIKDVEGLEAKYKTDIPENNNDPLEEAEKTIGGYIRREGLLVRLDGNGAFYSPSDDTVTIPEISTFVGAEEYYHTYFHELGHSTGHKDRLNRFNKGNAKFGSTVYSKEELIAEMTSSILMQVSGIATESTIKNSVAYLHGWLKAIREDISLIVMASQGAQKAVDLILGEDTQN